MNAPASAVLATALAFLLIGPAAASVQSQNCATDARAQKLKGAEAKSFIAKCVRGPQASIRPTAPTANNAESKAVVAPSGLDRAARTRQCAASADKRRLTGAARKDFQLSCIATAGPPAEAETQTKNPKPSHAIKGIGENNYGATPGMTTSAPH